MFLQNEHRERIKQIYAQTGKILEETLSYPEPENSPGGPLSYSSEQLFQNRGNLPHLNDLMYNDNYMMQGPLIVDD